MEIPVCQIEYTPLGDFTIWPAGLYDWPNPDGTTALQQRQLVEVHLGNGDDCWTRLFPEDLPVLAGQLEEFAEALRQYAADLGVKP